MTAAGADLARAGVGCSGWQFEPVMGSRQEGGRGYTGKARARGICTRHALAWGWLLRKTGWKAVFFKPFAEAAIIFMSDLFQAYDFIKQITISL